MSFPSYLLGYLDTCGNQCEHSPPILLQPHTLLWNSPTDLAHPTCPIWQVLSRAAPARAGEDDYTLVYLQSQQPNLTSGSAHSISCQWVQLEPQQMDWQKISGLITGPIHQRKSLRKQDKGQYPTDWCYCSHKRGRAGIWSDRWHHLPTSPWQPQTGPTEEQRPNPSGLPTTGKVGHSSLIDWRQMRFSTTRTHITNIGHPWGVWVW